MIKKETYLYANGPPKLAIACPVINIAYLFSGDTMIDIVRTQHPTAFSTPHKIS